jgi:hypothetical protein
LSEIAIAEDVDIPYLGPRAFVLVGRFDSRPESLSSTQRKVRVPDKFPSKGHDIGAALRDNLLRLLRLCDQADSTNGSVRKSFLDSLSKLNLEAIVNRAHWCVCAKHGPDSQA